MDDPHRVRCAVSWLPDDESGGLFWLLVLIAGLSLAITALTVLAVHGEL